MIKSRVERSVPSAVAISHHQTELPQLGEFLPVLLRHLAEGRVSLLEDCSKRALELCEDNEKASRHERVQASPSFSMTMRPDHTKVRQAYVDLWRDKRAALR